ncbi:MAG: NYN domain-containing protein [Hyphomicrobiaceae bacterium]
MLRWRIKSALYIDFENVPLPPESIGNWLAWLEDGAFDAAGRSRRFIQKRVYWNSHAERNRDLFQRHGFVPILIGKYSGLKNGADIRMAMDVVETTYTQAEIGEFILLTGDSDFVPVLERLKQKSKRSAIVVTEHRPNIHTTYHNTADILIPSRRLTEAAQYKRPRPGIVARLFGQMRSPDAMDRKGTVPATDLAVRQDTERARARARVRPPEDPPPVLETAARRVVRVLTQQPRNYVAQRRVLAELDRVQSFKRQGPTAYFGAGSYKALMQELARLEPRITVVEQPGGGTGVVYIPPQPSDTVPSQGTAAVSAQPVVDDDAMLREVPSDELSVADQAGVRDAGAAKTPIVSAVDPDASASGGEVDHQAHVDDFADRARSAGTEPEAAGSGEQTRHTLAALPAAHDA